MPRVSLGIAHAALLVACSSAEPSVSTGASPPHDAAAPLAPDASAPIESAPDASTGAPTDAAPPSPDASTDASEPDASAACSVDGNPGTCMAVSACAALGAAYTSTPGYCPGPADVECCAPTPNVADNPPVPAGWQLMPQADVTTAMTNWAVAILNDPATYPMFSTATQTFGAQLVLARVEWHPPDFQNSVVHRGVTLYVPVDGG